MVKILHVVHSLNEGGIERLLLEICRGIDKNKFEISVCCLVEKGNISDEFEKIGVKVILLGAERNFRLKSIFVNSWKIWELSRIIRKNKFSITHGHEFFSTVFSRISGLLGGAKQRYITLHNIYTWWGNGIHYAQKYLSFITTRIVCNSVSTLKYSLEKDRIKKDKYVVIYNGIDCSRFVSKNVDRTEFIKRYDLQKNSVICMSVGNISPRKGFEYLIQAANLLIHNHSELVYFIVGGKHHQETEELDKINSMIHEYNLGDRVFTVGPRRDIENILNYADLFIMPSVVEGFGLTLAEAMSAERLVISSDIEPFKEIVDDGFNGFMFRSENYKSLAETIEKVLRLKPEEVNIIKIKGRGKILEKFNSSIMCNKYEQLYLNNI